MIVGSGVRVGSWHKPVREWVTQNAETLKTKPVAFFTCGLTITDASKADEVRAFTDALIKRPAFGRSTSACLRAGTSRRSSACRTHGHEGDEGPVGDFRELDSVAAWTEKIAPQLGSG